jgi:hypothetical protein
MTDINLSFCRALLREAIKELKEKAPGIRPMKDAWVWKAGFGSWEFHGPDKYYWHGRAHNAYEARYKGWMAWLEARPGDLAGPGHRCPVCDVAYTDDEQLRCGCCATPRP